MSMDVWIPSPGGGGARSIASHPSAAGLPPSAPVSVAFAPVSVAFEPFSGGVPAAEHPVAAPTVKATSHGAAWFFQHPSSPVVRSDFISVLLCLGAESRRRKRRGASEKCERRVRNFFPTLVTSARAASPALTFARRGLFYR